MAPPRLAAAIPGLISPTVVKVPSLIGIRGRFQIHTCVVPRSCSCYDHCSDDGGSDCPQPHGDALPKAVEPGHPPGDKAATQK